ncbi:MAG: hypothetical protein RIC51_10560 [Erythrobacter sp.]|uniref:hypothetical protein n=1 Tax=Erythrobacter sp. TaxID=1042 RepID=UPI0032EB0FBA
MKKAVYRVRDSFGAYLNWPLNQEIALGDVGYWYNKRAKFERRTTLSELGIDVANPAAQLRMDEMLSDKSDCEFDAGAGTPLCTARFVFGNSYSFVAQSKGSAVLALSLDSLQSKLRSAIDNGLDWDRHWVIVTRLWQADHFSMLIAGARRAEGVISAQSAEALPSFNIADPSLKVGISVSKNLSYNGVAERGLTPFFDMHKLIFDPYRASYLRLYGQHDRAYN